MKDIIKLFSLLGAAIASARAGRRHRLRRCPEGTISTDVVSNGFRFRPTATAPSTSPMASHASPVCASNGTRTMLAPGPLLGTGFADQVTVTPRRRRRVRPLAASMRPRCFRCRRPKTRPRVDRLHRPARRAAGDQRFAGARPDRRRPGRRQRLPAVLRFGRRPWTRYIFTGEGGVSGNNGFTLDNLVVEFDEAGPRCRSRARWRLAPRRARLRDVAHAPAARRSVGGACPAAPSHHTGRPTSPAAHARPFLATHASSRACTCPSVFHACARAGCPAGQRPPSAQESASFDAFYRSTSPAQPAAQAPVFEVTRLPGQREWRVAADGRRRTVPRRRRAVPHDADRCMPTTRVRAPASAGVRPRSTISHGSTGRAAASRPAWSNCAAHPRRRTGAADRTARRVAAARAPAVRREYQLRAAPVAALPAGRGRRQRAAARQGRAVLPRFRQRTARRARGYGSKSAAPN